MNNSKLEPGIQKLCEKNEKIYNDFKLLSKKGIYGPFEIIKDEKQGYVVRTLAVINTNTLICEYAGDVFFLKNKIFDNNDSIMDLITCPNSILSMVICPKKYGNLARFISGINNKKNKQKQNVYSIRVDIHGSVHVLLLTRRKIKKGEILYYDYNGGGYNTYPTEEFV